MSNGQMKPEKAPVVNEELKDKNAEILVEEDFSAPSYGVEDPGSNSCNVKKYGILALAAILFLGLFAGIMIRTDGILEEVASIRDEVVEAMEAQKAQTAQVEALLEKAAASFEDLDGKIANASSVSGETLAALAEIRELYKETNSRLNETITTRDQLLRELIGSLRAETPDVQ